MQHNLQQPDQQIMHDPRQELIALRELPKLLPKRPNGKRVHLATIYRWIQRGVRGVRLRATKIGGSTFIEQRNLDDFIDKLSEPKESAISPITPKARTRAAERASKHVAELLNTKKPAVNRSNENRK